MEKSVGKLVFLLDKFLEENSNKYFHKDVMRMLDTITKENQVLKEDIEKIRNIVKI